METPQSLLNLRLLAIEICGPRADFTEENVHREQIYIPVCPTNCPFPEEERFRDLSLTDEVKMLFFVSRFQEALQCIRQLWDDGIRAYLFCVESDDSYDVEGLIALDLPRHHPFYERYYRDQIIHNEEVDRNHHSQDQLNDEEESDDFPASPDFA